MRSSLFKRRAVKASTVRRGWIDRWILRRLQPAALPWSVNRRRVYILPTRFGVGFALLCVVMLLGAMNYSNSMGFALTFCWARSVWSACTTRTRNWWA